MARHAQIDQNNKFANFCNIIRKKYIGDEVDFLHADKHQSFLQIDFNPLGIKVSYKMLLTLLMDMIKHSQSTQSNKFAYLYRQYLKKKLGVEFVLCIGTNTKVSTSWRYRFLWKWLDMSKVPKIGSW